MLKTLAFTGLLLVSCVNAFAHGATWVNNEELKKVSSVAILPLQGEACYSGAETFIRDNLAKRNKDTNFMVVPGGEPQEIATRYGANAYIITTVRENSVRQDWSPEIYYEFTQHAYSEEKGGPKGNFRYNESEYADGCTLPGRYVDLKKVNIDFVMYNTNGDVIMTMQDRNYSYDKTDSDLAKAIIKEMAITWRNAKKDAKSPISFSCQLNQVPERVSEDPFLSNALDYTIEFESTRYKKIPSSSEYYVTADVSTYEEAWNWFEPHGSTSLKQVDSSSYKWTEYVTNKEGKRVPKERTAHRYRYVTEPVYSPGGYDVKGKVTATINLVDSATNSIVLTHTDTTVHAKEIDSFREIVRDFYKKVEKEFKK